MEGIIAVGGFWLCMIAIALKKPIMAYIEKSKVANKDVALLTDRLQQLETAVVSIGKEVQEVKDTSDFAHKLLIDSAQQIADAHKLLSHNAQQMADAHRFLSSVQQGAVPSKVTVVEQSAPEPKLLTNEPKLITSTPLISELGKVISDGTIRFERSFSAPIERVWQYLTASDCLSQWLAQGSVDQKFGGKVDFTFDVDEMPERKDEGATIHGVVSMIEPLRTLAFSWNDGSTNLHSNVCFQLSSQGDQTSVVMTHSQLPADRLHEFMAGWHTHFDILKARLTDTVAPAFSKRYREVLQTYAAVVATTLVVSTSAATPSAMAQPSHEAYQAIQSEKSHILSRYDSLARDADDLKRQIAELKRDTSPEAGQALNNLEKQLDDHNRDLHTLDLEIRDLDNALK